MSDAGNADTVIPGPVLTHRPGMTESDDRPWKAQNDPKIEPRAMITARAITGPIMPTMMISR